MLDGAAWKGGGRRPCIKPKSVFFDLDGVLLNSLPFYVIAWKEAFEVVSVDFPEIRVYEQEGKRGTETIIDMLTDQAHVSLPFERVFQNAS
ncbi:MAG: hypothetical protein ACRD82_18070, partial [Blastocatellia bacterium]